MTTTNPNATLEITELTQIEVLESILSDYYREHKKAEGQRREQIEHYIRCTKALLSDIRKSYGIEQ